MRDKVAACIKKYDVSLENTVKIVASMTGLSEDIIYLLKDVEIFESSRKTHNLRRKLMKKHLLEPITDEPGRSKRKIYRVTQFKAMLIPLNRKAKNHSCLAMLTGRGYYDRLANFNISVYAPIRFFVATVEASVQFKKVVFKGAFRMAEFLFLPRNVQFREHH